MDWKEARKIMESDPSQEQVKEVLTEVRAHTKLISETTKDYAYLHEEDCKAVLRELARAIFGEY